MTEQVWSKGEREEGAEYWVTDSRHVWLAKASKRAAGGWTNEDTWEDFDRKVVAWIKADVPAAPGQGESL